MLRIAKTYYEVGRNYKVLRTFKSFKAAKEFRFSFAQKKNVPISDIYVDMLRKSRWSGYTVYQSVERFKTATNVVKAYGED